MSQHYVFVCLLACLLAGAFPSAPPVGAAVSQSKPALHPGGARQARVTASPRRPHRGQCPVSPVETPLRHDRCGCHVWPDVHDAVLLLCLRLRLHLHRLVLGREHLPGMGKRVNRRGSRGDCIPAETLVMNGTAGDNGTACGTLNQSVLDFLVG